MLRRLGEKMGIQGCPIKALLTLRENFMESLRGKISADVLRILDKLVPKFAPRGKDTYREDLWDHLEANYINRGGDPAFLNSFLRAFAADINKLKYAHENLLGRADAERRIMYPELWSTDNILYGLKHIDPIVQESFMRETYGAELWKLPMRLARNISLLFEVLNSWLMGSQNTMLNQVFHPALDGLDSISSDFMSQQTEDMYELMHDFHFWVVRTARSQLMPNIPKMGIDIAKVLLYEKINFFIGSTQVHQYGYEEASVLAGSIGAGLDSAVSMYLIILFKISQTIPGNPDGTMSLAQKKLWTKTVQNFMVPNAKKSHAWAGKFFDAIDSRGKNGVRISRATFDALQVTGIGENSHIDLIPEGQAFLGFHMMQSGMRQNGCPALKSILGKPPALFRLAEITRRWYDESKIQVHIPVSKGAE